MLLSGILRASGSWRGFPDVDITDLGPDSLHVRYDGFSEGGHVDPWNLSANAESIVSYLHLTADDRGMAILPFYYSYGTPCSLPTSPRWKLVLHNSFRFPEVILEKMIQEEATVVFLGFLHVRDPAEPFQHPEALLSPARYVTQAGGAMSAGHALELTRILPNAEILYHVRPDRGVRTAFLSGAQGSGPESRVHREAIPASSYVRTIRGRGILRDTGEIVAFRLGTSWPATGTNRKKTAKVLREDGLHTGDLARTDEEGFLYIVGREERDDQERRPPDQPKEIEEVLLEIPKVHEVVVAGVGGRNSGGDHRGVHRPDGGPEPRRTRCLPTAEEPSPYKVPKRVTFLAELPKTESGKVRRHELSRGRRLSSSARRRAGGK